MKRGEVWRVRLSTVPGHTQAGIRPAVIVQDEQATLALPTVLIVPFTGTQGALRFSGTLAVPPDGQNGLTVPSVALVFQLTAQGLSVDSDEPRRALWASGGWRAPSWYGSPDSSSAAWR